MSEVLDVALAVVTLVVMEPLAGAVHHFFGHGIGWRFHRGHHVRTRTGWLEDNDVIPAGMAIITMILMAVGVAWSSLHVLVPIGAGMTAYGALYFLVHDVYIHRRLPILPRRISWLEPQRAAHLVHHRSTAKDGTGPYCVIMARAATLSLRESGTRAR